jgi:hypothetical protein
MSILKTLRFLLAIALAILPMLLMGQVLNPRGIQVLNNSVSAGFAYALNYTGGDCTISSGVATCTAGSGGGNTLPHPILSGRRWGFVQASSLSTGPAFTPGATVVGMPDPAPATGSASTIADLTGTTRIYWQWTSAATNDTIAGWTGNFNQTRPSYRPKLTGIIRTDTAIDTRRLWFGLTEQSLTLVTHAAGPTASLADFIGLGFDSSIGGNWRVCSGDGANYTCVDTGVAILQSFEYTLTLDWSVAGTLTWKINGTSGTKTTNLSTNAVNLGIHNAITTLSAAARNHQFTRLVLEHN